MTVWAAITYVFITTSHLKAYYAHASLSRGYSAEKGGTVTVMEGSEGICVFLILKHGCGSLFFWGFFFAFLQFFPTKLHLLV